MAALGRIIRGFRGDRSIRAYARAVGVTHGAVRAWEADQASPKLATAARIIADARLTDGERALFLDVLVSQAAENVG
jgi:DNA-binding XRE family transcriptional regulator